MLHHYGSKQISFISTYIFQVLVGYDGAFKTWEHKTVTGVRVILLLDILEVRTLLFKIDEINHACYFI